MSEIERLNRRVRNVEEDVHNRMRLLEARVAALINVVDTALACCQQLTARIIELEKDND